MENKKNKRAQAWVETAVYTLIGLSIIGIVLAVANPIIERYKDEIVIEDTITALNSLNNDILNVKDMGTGNRRVVEFNLKKGILIIDCLESRISYVLEDSRLEYSEAGQEISRGDIKIKTEKKGKKYGITLSLEYDNIALNYNEEFVKKTFTPSPIPYKLQIENFGILEGNINIVIGIKESN